MAVPRSRYNMKHQYQLEPLSFPAAGWCRDTPYAAARRLIAPRFERGVTELEDLLGRKLPSRARS